MRRTFTLDGLSLLLCFAALGCGRAPSAGGGAGGGGPGGGAGGGAAGAEDGGADAGDTGGAAGGDQGGEGSGGAAEIPDTYSFIQLQDISRGGRPAEGTLVKIEGVVTAGPNSRGSFHVQDAAASGPWTGIFAYNPGAVGDVRHVSVDGVRPGKTVSVTGEIVEFTRNDDATGGAVTELKMTGLTVEGDAPVPAPVDVDAATLVDEATAEQWEGILVSVGAVEILETGLAGGLFSVTGGLRVGHLYYDHSGSVGQQISHLVGVLHYDYGEFRLEPRSADDVGAQRADLPVLEPADLQNPAAQPESVEGQLVAIEGVVVTAGPSEDGKSLFVESPSGGAYSGIYVYNKDGGVDLTGVEVGVTVHLEGRYQEFKYASDPHPDTVSEISLSDIEVVGPAPIQPEPEAVAIAELATEAAGEPWEGVLVVLSEVRVDTIDAEAGQFTLEGGLLVDDLLFALSPAPGDAFATLVGVVHFAAGKFQLLPRSAADATPDAG